jgi:hypothetical protein
MVSRQVALLVGRTLFSHNKLWANLIRPQFIMVFQGWVGVKEALCSEKGLL